MDNLNALGHYMYYCNNNIRLDENVTQERFMEGSQIIMRSLEGRFSHCRTTGDVLFELHWPNVR